MLTFDMEKDWMESRGLCVHKCHIIEKLKPYMNKDGIYDIQKHQSEAGRLPLSPDYKDAAEFEARVVVGVTRLYKSLANISILPNQMGVIKQARINVEKKMETEQC